jgi:hypothetical protein
LKLNEVNFKINDKWISINDLSLKASQIAKIPLDCKEETTSQSKIINIKILFVEQN